MVDVADSSLQVDSPRPESVDLVSELTAKIMMYSSDQHVKKHARCRGDKHVYSIISNYYADDSHRSEAISSVCVCVCLCVVIKPKRLKLKV